MISEDGRRALTQVKRSDGRKADTVQEDPYALMDWRDSHHAFTHCVGHAAHWRRAALFIASGALLAIAAPSTLAQGPGFTPRALPTQLSGQW